MLRFNSTLADITSNARIKEYPSQSVLQVANAPVFRQAGYEPRKRTYDVPPKGKADDPVRSMEVSRARAKAAVLDIALCNPFTHFFTWTLDPKVIDRFDANVVGKKVQTFLKNASYRKGFSYVCVPELHDNGAIHLHGLCNPGAVKLVPAINPHTGKPLLDDSGRPLYNMADWKLGFSSCVQIDENYARTCGYVTKYMSKGTEKIFGKWYLSSRNLRKRPDIELIDGGVDFEAFVAENPQAPVVPVYRDICMAIVQQPKKGGVACDPW